MRTISSKELDGILERSKKFLSESDVSTMHFVFNHFSVMDDMMHEKNMTLKLLKKYLYGSSSEKNTRKKDANSNNDTKDNESVDKQGLSNANGAESTEDVIPENKEQPNKKPKDKEKAKGHGRHGTDKYPGAESIKVLHDQLKAGDPCPCCSKGRLRPKDPVKVMRFHGIAPIGATKFEMDRFRCSRCLEYVSADLPEEAGQDKYTPSAVSMLGLMKYNYGLPFNRIEGMLNMFGVPIAKSTQYDILKSAYDSGLSTLFNELMKYGAQSHTFFIDDTYIKVLDMMGKRKSNYIENNPDSRLGMFTTGIVCKNDDFKVVIFNSGNHHAGENIEKLLSLREEGLQIPKLMCDALPSNTSRAIIAEILNCFTHARRRFDEIKEFYPEICTTVLDLFSNIYYNDKQCKELNMSEIERLNFHQKHSSSLMKRIYEYINHLYRDVVEPSSRIGNAIKYTLNRWKNFKKLLIIPGVPLDNNICEMALKKPIINRKNAYFFRSFEGCDVADAFMSLIYSCELNGINAFQYLENVLSNLGEMIKKPEVWLPWNYKQNLNLNKR